MDGDARLNPYLSGNYAPIRSEDDFDLEVEGQIPAGLRGALYRIGANPQFDPHDPNYHWFSGDGMVHGFFVEDGKVRYRNRFVRTPKFELERDAGRSLFGTFGNPMTTDPMAMGRDSGVANTNILYHAGHLMALEEGHLPFEMDPRTLGSIGYMSDYRGRVTAHPKIDATTGEMVWFGYSVGDVPMNGTMSYGVTDKTGKVTRRDNFETPFSAMVHDFLVTENYVLFPVLPLTMSLERAMTGRPPLAWEPDQGGYVGVMRRDADISTLRWFNVDPCYVFHPMNAWEADGKLFADVCRYDAAPLFPRLDGRPMERAAAQLYRWTFDLSGASNAIREEKIDDRDGEFPRFDERRMGLSYRHGWFAADLRNTRSVKLNTIAHIDHQTGAQTNYVLPEEDQTSEPVFTPRSDTAEEGDGWITAVVWRGSENRSDLLVFDALHIKAGPIATAKLPRRVPFGFHGNWVPATSL